MKFLGLMFVLLGLLVWVDGGIPYNRERTIHVPVPFGPTLTQRENVPWAPIGGAIVLIGGAMLLVAPRRRLARVLPDAPPRS
jgi:hypothetical protein